MAENFGFDCRVYAMELDFDALFASFNPEKSYTPLPKYPSTTRDLAFLCDKELEVGKIESVIATAGGKTVENIALFDIYEGKQVPDGQKSVAFSVTMRLPDTPSPTRKPTRWLRRSSSFWKRIWELPFGAAQRACAVAYL